MSHHEAARHDQTVGVLGLGAMGAPIVRHLLDAEVPVVVLDLDDRAVSDAVERGAKAVDDAASLGGTSDVVLVIVPSDDDVRSVCLGQAGLLAQVSAGGTVLICSSVRPDTCGLLAEAAPAGVAVLDAALTGGVRGAVDGTINLLVGGDATALDAVCPQLDPWTKSVHHLGELGAGQVGKTANNLVHWAQICAITEALELGRRWGIGVPALRQALMDGPTDSRTLRELEQMRLTWHAKDLANAVIMADAVAWELPVGRTAQAVMPAITVERLARLLAGDDPDF